MLKLVEPHLSGLLPSIQLCYRQSDDEDARSKQPKGRLVYLSCSFLLYQLVRLKKLPLCMKIAQLLLYGSRLYLQLAALTLLENA